MTTEIYVRDSSEFILKTTSLGTLYDSGSKGKDTKGSKIDRATGFLQRLAQKTIWQSDTNAKCKEYISSLIKGSNLLDSFVVVPSDLLLATVDNRIETTSDEIKEAWIEVKEYLEERVNKGTTQFIIDGQNRLFEAIIPFFDNLIPLPTNQSVTFVIDGKEYDCRSKIFKDLPEQIQDWIKEIKIPIVKGTRGDLEQFCDTLIWKNEGIAWDDWQKMVTRNWFTKYLRQIRQLSDRDNSDPLITNLLGKIAGNDYQYDRNGWDRIISELLMWMVRGVQVSKLDEVKLFFEGNYKVSQTQIDSLSKYLREFSQAYENNFKGGADKEKARGITNTELRNYIYLRYAIDNPKKETFEGLSVPNWKIKKGVSFASTYKKYNALLMKKPEQFGELANRLVATDGSGLSGKNPGSYTFVNSLQKKTAVLARLEILFSVLAGRKEQSRKVLDELINGNIITVLSVDKTPSMAQIHENNPYTADGDAVDVVDHDDTNLFDIGHYTPKSKGGSNEDVVLQKKSPNRKLQDNPIPI
jgi:hypothetical protein